MGRENSMRYILISCFLVLFFSINLTFVAGNAVAEDDTACAQLASIAADIDKDSYTLGETLTGSVVINNKTGSAQDISAVVSLYQEKTLYLSKDHHLSVSPGITAYGLETALGITPILPDDDTYIGNWSLQFMVNAGACQWRAEDGFEIVESVEVVCGNGIREEGEDGYNCPEDCHTGINLVSNPSFEDPSPGNPENPADWDKKEDDETHILTWDNTIAYEGLKSVKLEVLNSTKELFKWSGKDIPMKPNSVYVVEYWYKTEDLPPEIDSPQAGLTIEYFDETSNWIGAEIVQIPWEPGDTDWTKETWSFFTPSNLDHANIVFLLYFPSGKIWFDKVSLYEVILSPIEENPNYEFYFNGIKGICHGWGVDVDLGVEMVRTDILWASIEKTKGVYDFSGYDYATDRLLAKGIEPLFLLLYSNCLYNSMPPNQGYRCDRYVPRDPAEFEIFKKAYGDYVYESVKYYKEKYNGKVKYFELWNEQNSVGFWEPIQDEYQAIQYIDLMKEGYKRAKQANPDCVIISGGLAGTGRNVINRYIKNYYKQGAKDYFDILGVHTYCPSDATEPKQDQGKMCSNVYNLGKIRNIMDSYGDKDKKIWITEFGYPTAGCWSNGVCPKNLSEENQDIRLNNIFPTLRAFYPSVTGFFWYCHEDNGRLPFDVEGNFGLLRVDNSKKAAWDSYKRLVPKSSISCPCCGNGVCEPGENYLLCPDDCPKPVFCNEDGICDPGENLENCGCDCENCPNMASVNVTVDKDNYSFGETITGNISVIHQYIGPVYVGLGVALYHEVAKDQWKRVAINQATIYTSSDLAGLGGVLESDLKTAFGGSIPSIPINNNFLGDWKVFFKVKIGGCEWIAEDSFTVGPGLYGDVVSDEEESETPENYFGDCGCSGRIR